MVPKVFLPYALFHPIRADQPNLKQFRSFHSPPPNFPTMFCISSSGHSCMEWSKEKELSSTTSLCCCCPPSSSSSFSLSYSSYSSSSLFGPSPPAKSVGGRNWGENGRNPLDPFKWFCGWKMPEETPLKRQQFSATVQFSFSFLPPFFLSFCPPFCSFGCPFAAQFSINFAPNVCILLMFRYEIF